jgi:hypothetical protein
MAVLGVYYAAAALAYARDRLSLQRRHIAASRNHPNPQYDDATGEGEGGAEGRTAAAEGTQQLLPAMSSIKLTTASESMGSSTELLAGGGSLEWFGSISLAARGIDPFDLDSSDRAVDVDILSPCSGCCLRQYRSRCGAVDGNGAPVPQFTSMEAAFLPRQRNRDAGGFGA